MSDIPDLISRNRLFADTFTQGGLSMSPRLSTFVVTCLDARMDPGRILGLEIGDAVVMRNAGGRVTPSVLRDLVVLGFLASTVPGKSGFVPEIMIIHHTDCGLARLAEPEAQRLLAERLAVEPSEIEALAAPDPYQSVHDDIGRLRGVPGLPDDLLVAGFVYDVSTGRLSEVQ